MSVLEITKTKAKLMRGKVSLMYVTTLGTEMKGMHYNIALGFDCRQGALNIRNRYET